VLPRPSPCRAVLSSAAGVPSRGAPSTSAARRSPRCRAVNKAVRAVPYGLPRPKTFHAVPRTLSTLPRRVIRLRPCPSRCLAVRSRSSACSPLARARPIRCRRSLTLRQTFSQLQRRVLRLPPRPTLQRSPLQLLAQSPLQSLPAQSLSCREVECDAAASYMKLPGPFSLRCAQCHTAA